MNLSDAKFEGVPEKKESYSPKPYAKPDILLRQVSHPITNYKTTRGEVSVNTRYFRELRQLYFSAKKHTTFVLKVEV